VTELELDELGPATELALTPDQGRLLAVSGVVSATPSPFDSGRWFVGPAGKVGAVRIGDVMVRIKPKVEIARLLFMLGYSCHGAAWQASSVDVGEAPDLVPAIAQALWRQVSRAIHQGLLPGYVTCEDSSPVLRGRLLESAQLARHHGLPLPLEISYDEFTVDIRKTRSCALPASGCCSSPGEGGVVADAAAPAARLRGRPLDTARRSRARMATDPHQRSLPRGPTPGGASPAGDLGGARCRTRGRQRVPAQHAPAFRGLRHGRSA
jgi:hypothetical protein